MSAAHSMDLRERVIAAWRAGEPQTLIARRFVLGYATVRRYVARLQHSGTVRPKPHGGGAPRAIGPEGEGWLRAALAARPDVTDEELARAYSAHAGRPVSRSTVLRTVKRMGLTRKKSHSTPASATRRR